MAVNLKKILCGFNGQQDMDCVFGYIKECHPNIPDIVMHIVLSYYHMITDEWDTNAVGDDMKISQDGILHRTNNKHRYQSAFLSQIADVGSYKWKFKVIDYDNLSWHYNYLIGIWNINSAEKSTNDLVNDYFSRDYENMYGYLASCAMKTSHDKSSCSDKYGVEIQNDDIVEMHLDLDKLELKFSVNGKDFGKAFNVKQGRYRAVVLLGKQGNKIQILPNDQSNRKLTLQLETW